MGDWLIIKRGAAQQVPLVLIPGWGFTGAVLKDHAAFRAEALLVPLGFTSEDMLAGLFKFLEEEEIDQVRILGWSMGGNLAVDFARRYPHHVVSLTLVAVRQHWCAEDIAFTRQGLHEGTGLGMEKFYRKCFLGSKSDYRQFASNLLMSYAEERDVCFLDKGLNYLGAHHMPESLAMPVHIVQGTKDVVCPVTEMVQFASNTQTTMLDGVGHFPFSHTDFRV